MLRISPSILAEAVGCTAEAAEDRAPYLEEAASRWPTVFGSPVQLAHYLAQVGHESGSYKAGVESFDYTSARLLEVFGGRISEEDANRYGRTSDHPADQVRLANILYGGEWGKKNLGNVNQGDGWLFRGRGDIQTTGRYNYYVLQDQLKAVGISDAPDFQESPEKLILVRWRVLCSVAFWVSKGCHKAALADDLEKVTKLVNGGLNGLEDRRKRLLKAKEVVEREKNYLFSTIIPPASTPVPGWSPTKPLPEAPVPGATGKLNWPFQPTPSTPKENTVVAPIIAAAAFDFGSSLIGKLAAKVAEAFEPLAKEKLVKELGRHTDNPAVAAQVGEAIVNTVRSATGIDDPLDAVTEGRKNPEVIAAAQTSALDVLDRLMPALEKAHEFEKDEWAASEASMRAAHERLINNPNNQDEYLTKAIVRMVLGLLIVVAILIGVAMVAKSSELNSLIVFFTTIGGGIAAKFGTRYDHAYGSSRGSAAKDVTVDAAMAALKDARRK